MRWHLAQVNVGRVRAPVDSPQLSGFMAQLEPINALADASPGFLWRLQTEDGDATAIRPFDDDSILVNMSLWESLDALGEFVYRSAHVEVMRHRREWFHRAVDAYLALWWLPAGALPTVADAATRLEVLRERGPSAYAFTFRETFPPPDVATDSHIDTRWGCPTP